MNFTRLLDFLFGCTPISAVASPLVVGHIARALIAAQSPIICSSQWPAIT